VLTAALAAAAGWFGYGLVALITGVAAALLPFVQWRAANATLASRFARRQISENDARYLIKALSPLAMLDGSAEQRRVSVFATSQVFEATALAHQLSAVLVASGWFVNPNKVDYGMNWHVEGVGILAHQNPGSQQAASGVASALNKLGIATHLVPGGFPTFNRAPNLDPTCAHGTSISILIGDKPSTK
jgi:hypothetical protein